eukprot:659971-Pelagomonas_calceolata.AAC.3
MVGGTGAWSSRARNNASHHTVTCYMVQHSTAHSHLRHGAGEWRRWVARLPYGCLPARLLAAEGCRGRCYPWGWDWS